MKKKIIKISTIVTLSILAVIFYEMTVFSPKTVNRDSITINLNNIRNPQIKKIMRELDNYYASLIFVLSNNAKAYLINDDRRENLPEKKIIKKTNKFSENLYPLKNNQKNWHRNHSNHASNRFSDLKQINKQNLHKLSVAWEFEINAKSFFDIQSNVIVAENKIFIPSFNKKIICLDAQKGYLLWEFDLKSSSPRRGMVFHKSNDKSGSKIFFPSYKNLISLNTSTGDLNKDFGKNGIVKLNKPSLTAPAIFKNNLIITTSEPSLNIYDLNNGKLLWKYILMEEKMKSRNGGKRYDYSGGNPWGGFSLDKKRGIAYITTGNAGRYFNGVNRPGRNKYANSIIAIDLINKVKVWDFQEVSHDIWNLDIPAPPILGSITKDGKKIDVVIAVTKLGNTIVLDRMSGKPIFDFHFKKAPASILPGEKTSVYQPNLKIPEPFAKQVFDLNEVTNINEESKNFILNKIKDYNYGFFEPYQLNKKNIQFNFHGGAEWAGGSFDLKSETLYVSSSNIAWETEIDLVKKKNKFAANPYYKYNSSFKRLKDQFGYPGSKPPWGTITAINLQTGKIKWQKPFGEYESLNKTGVLKTGTENYSGVTGTASGILLATGTLDKKFTIFDSSNGRELWSYKLPFIGSSPPITYMINNEQFILVNATGSYSLKKGYPEIVEYGNKIIAFKIKP